MSAAGDALDAGRALSVGSERVREGRGISFYLSAAWIGIVFVIAATVQWLPLPSYVLLVGDPNQPPDLTHLFLGTDSVGRSMLARLCYGARMSLLIGVTSTVIAMTVGAALGLLATSSRAAATYVIDAVVNAVLAVPPLLLLLAIVLALRPTLGVLIAALSLSYVPAFLRLTRANALVQMSREYVLAARGLGASRWRVMLREVLPNAIPPLLSYSTLVLPGIIIAEGSLSFLGFGVQAPTPSWGAMIAESETTLTENPWQGLIPCIVLFMTVLSFNTIGDEMRKRLGPTGRAL